MEGRGDLALYPTLILTLTPSEFVDSRPVSDRLFQVENSPFLFSASKKIGSISKEVSHVMEQIKKGDWVVILPDKGVKPEWVGKKAYVQQTLIRDGLPILFCYIFGEGTAMLNEDQVRLTKGEESHEGF
jgi:hypothetical protein